MILLITLFTSTYINLFFQVVRALKENKAERENEMLET